MPSYGASVNGAMQQGRTLPFAVMYMSDHGRRQARHAAAADSSAAGGNASLEPRSVMPRSAARDCAR